MNINPIETASKGSVRGREHHFLGLLRAVGLIAVVAGAVGSVGLMLYVGRHNGSWLLRVLFTIWVLSPFAALVVANVFSKRWAVPTRVVLYSLMVIIALGSLIVFGSVALSSPKARPAFMFVVVPPASWLLSGIVLSIAALVSGRTSRRSDGV